MAKTTGGLGIEKPDVNNEIAVDLSNMALAVEMFDRELDLDLDMLVIDRDADAGVNTEIDYLRKDSTVQKRATLTNKNGAGKYTTLTIQYFSLDGNTVIATRVFTLAYDADGNLESRSGVRT